LKKLLGIAVSTLALCLNPLTALATIDSATGLWKTIDDVTGKPKSIIQITETPNRKLQGTILKIFPRPGFDQNELCVACKGARHNQPIVGMTILTGLELDRANHGRWNNGEILDPLNGKTYHSTIQLSDHNAKLTVRGYIGMPLFGRSQVWERVNDLNSDS
jgi:uncharacterized protein (DUF2147 family)